MFNSVTCSLCVIITSNLKVEFDSYLIIILPVLSMTVVLSPEYESLLLYYSLWVTASLIVTVITLYNNIDCSYKGHQWNNTNIIRHYV